MHPDNYRFGRLEQRIELFELLRNNGVYVELSQERCERYAVIDGNIVWYGSVNLLFKDDVDDNIIRLENNNVASELLEISFCKESQNNEFNCHLNKAILRFLYSYNKAAQAAINNKYMNTFSHKLHFENEFEISYLDRFDKALADTKSWQEEV